MTARRRSHRDRYAVGLADVPDVRLLGRAGVPGDEGDNCWLTGLVIGDSWPLGPADVIGALAAADIESRHVWKPMHRQPVYAVHRAAVTGVAERLFDRGVVLPSGSVLRDGDIDRVLDVLRRVLR
jgi:dTDP-4-amino-4,6-dideoxygalactose transaminase